MPIGLRTLAMLVAAATGSVAQAALANDDPPAAVIRVTVSDAWGPPFLLPGEGAGAARRGLIPDWYTALGRELGQPLELQMAPPTRAKRRARDGQFDLRCFYDPAWDAGPSGEAFVEVPQPGFTIEERIVTRSGMRPVQGLADLRGRRIGTVLGYRYPSLEPGFDAGSFTREDAPAEMNLLEKQLAGRTEVAVVRLATLAWLQHEDPRWRALDVSPFVVSTLRLSCSIRRGAPLDARRLMEAQRRLIDAGELDALLRRYGQR